MTRVPADQRARRLLVLLHVLQPDSRIPLDALARMTGVSEPEIAADLELLSICAADQRDPTAFVPVFVEDGYVEVFGELPALEKAVRLSAAEARALAAALQAAGMDSTDGLLQRLLSAAANADIDPAQIEQVLRSAPGSLSADALKALALALEERRAVTIVYHGIGKISSGERTVEPLALHNERGAWYLQAFCRTAGSVRTFRVDRIRDATVTGERFEPREPSPLSAALAIDELPLARIRLQAGERVSDREWPGVRVVDRHADGSYVVEVPYAGTGWIARRVLARLGGAAVIAPAAVREAVADLAHDALGW